MNPDHVAPATSYRDDTIVVPPVTVAVANPDSSTWERVLTAVKNVAVIITCIVVLYTAYRGYMFAAAVADALDSFGTTFGTLGQ